MSDKLQEIKDNLMQREHYADYAVNLITAEKKQREDLKWLIEQLEQAQEENERLLQRNQELSESLEAVFPYIGNIGDSSLIGSLKEHVDGLLGEDER